ncbi:MAG TPA: hypothetical protein DIW30_04335 [Bacteroidales bacterium]|nr:hypothetical protein [Bacteroidales bacterium]
MSAQLVGWTALEYGGTTVSSGNTTIRQALSNSDGEVFIIGQGSSVGDAPTLTLFGQEHAVCPFKANMSQSNTNFIIAKTDKDFNPLWTSVSNRGNFDNTYAGLTTDDGGLLLVVSGKHADQNRLGDNKVMQFTGTNGTGLSWEETYNAAVSKKYGAIIRYSAAGEPTLLAKLYTSDAASTSMTFCDLKTDGTNYYLLAVLNPGLVIGNDTIKSEVLDAEGKVLGSLVIVKFDKDFKMLSYIKTGGVTVSSSSASLTCANNKLYLATSVAKANAGDNVTLGTQSVAMTPTNSALFAVLSTDLQCEKLTLIEGTNENSKNTFSLNSMEVVGDNAYLSGFFMGGIKTDAGQLTNTGTNNAFLLQLDIAAGKCVKGVQIGTSAGIATAQCLLTRGDSLYQYYYDWGQPAGQARIFLQAYDTDLNMGATYPLIKASAMEAIFGASIAGNNLVYTFRTRATLSFVADDSQSFTSANKQYKGLVAMQTLFPKSTTPTGNTTSTIENNDPKAQKVIINGQLYIRRGEQLFNVLGQML